jgi:hypothetical protein
MSAVSELGNAPAQAGVLLVSDGRATTPDTLDAAQLALARSVPLWTWTLGRPSRHDLWIETASAEALAFSGAEVELAATVRAAGYRTAASKSSAAGRPAWRRARSFPTRTASRASPCA